MGVIKAAAKLVKADIQEMKITSISIPPQKTFKTKMKNGFQIV